MEGVLKSLSSILLPLFLISGGVVATSESEVYNGMTWCVAKPSTAEIALVDNIGYACSMVDCTILQEGNACYYPNNNISHASVAMNLYYQTRGRNNWNCDFASTGLIVATDPSFGSCVYLAANY